MEEHVTLALQYGQDEAQFRVPAKCLLRPVNRRDNAEAIPDVAAAVRNALESPLDFPPLRQALTPDDSLAILVNEHYRRLPDLLVPVLQHIEQAGIHLERATLLCPPRLPGVAPPPWREQLPQEYAAIRVEEHDPKNRQRLCYLAATQAGRRLYLNRTLVEADQIILVGPASYDPVLGFGGGFGDLFPSLADEEVRREFLRRAVAEPPGEKPNLALREAQEVSWLLGVPFWVAAVPGRGDDIQAILAGPLAQIAPRVREALALAQDYRFPWRAEVVVTALSGDPRWLSFEDLTRALAVASRLVQPGGKIFALAHINAETLGPAARQLEQFDNPITLLSHARRDFLADTLSIWYLAVATRRASIYLYGSLPQPIVRNMYATPVGSLQEIQRVLERCGSCIFLPDGHRANASVTGTMPAVVGGDFRSQQKS
ncbi:MAG: lactate racemase domain-containing protein [Gemmatales bacterium]|nr:lactate racemase domain-containing protein [Gemmatales bacterium]MDW8176782.1 lactate racemase domain-containing protein [Gemmatales bacterium]